MQPLATAWRSVLPTKISISFRSASLGQNGLDFDVLRSLRHTICEQGLLSLRPLRIPCFPLLGLGMKRTTIDGSGPPEFHLRINSSTEDIPMGMFNNESLE
jgi:hypothetical protein